MTARGSWLGLWLLIGSRLTAGEAMVLEVSAGALERRETPLRWQVSSIARLLPALKLTRLDDGKRIPVQLDPGEPPAIVWLLEQPLAPGEKRRYRLERGEAGESFPQVECQDLEKKHLLFRLGDRNLLRYNYGVIEPPAGIGPNFARSGYIHPVWSPSGRVLSNDFPPNHKHHHGIWMPWSQTEFEGHPIDFWEQDLGQGKVECGGVERRISGPVCGGFFARHRFLDLKAIGGPKPVLNETWDVRIYPVAKYSLLDLVAVQECAGSSPLHLKQHRYGGFGFRGSADWEGEKGVEFLTSEGKTRADGHATTSRWCEVHGKVGGEPCGIGFLCHPGNFRFPQGMRIHDKEPFFNYTPCQAGDFEIAPGKPYVARYRMVLHDGRLEAQEMERLWRDYVEPPAVEVVAGCNDAR